MLQVMARIPLRQVRYLLTQLLMHQPRLPERRERAKLRFHGQHLHQMVAIRLPITSFNIPRTMVLRGQPLAMERARQLRQRLQG